MILRPDFHLFCWFYLRLTILVVIFGIVGLDRIYPFTILCLATLLPEIVPSVLLFSPLMMLVPALQKKTTKIHKILALVPYNLNGVTFYFNLTISTDRYDGKVRLRSQVSSCNFIVPRSDAKDRQSDQPVAKCFYLIIAVSYNSNF